MEERRGDGGKQRRGDGRAIGEGRKRTRQIMRGGGVTGLPELPNGGLDFRKATRHHKAYKKQSGHIYTIQKKQRGNMAVIQNEQRSDQAREPRLAKAQHSP